MFAVAASATARGIALCKMQREAATLLLLPPPPPAPAKACLPEVVEPIDAVPFAHAAVFWTERATAYRQSVAAMTVPACHRSKLTAAIIVAQVAEEHGFTAADLRGTDRHRPLVRARHAAMWRISRELGRTLPEIGRALGGRDHTTVLNGIRRHKERLDAASAAGIPTTTPTPSP